MSQNTDKEEIPYLALWFVLVVNDTEVSRVEWYVEINFMISRAISVFFIRFEYYDHIDMSNTLTVTDVNEASSMMAINDIYRSTARIFTVTTA